MKTTRVIDFFGDLNDHRSSNGNKQHELLDIIAITICAVVCGAELWEEISEYGRIKKEWLSSFLSLPNGIPSHDTFNRVMSSLDPLSFESCFSNWVSSLIVATNEVIPNKNIIYTNFDNWFFYVIFGLYYISYYGACENFGY